MATIILILLDLMVIMLDVLHFVLEWQWLRHITHLMS
jgi:hypothetical protein